MIKNICIIIAGGILMTSCKMSFSAVTPTQKYSGSVTIYDVPEVEDWKK